MAQLSLCILSVREGAREREWGGSGAVWCVAFSVSFLNFGLVFVSGGCYHWSITTNLKKKRGTCTPFTAFFFKFLARPHIYF